MDYAVAIMVAIAGRAAVRVIGVRSRCDGNSTPNPHAGVVAAVAGAGCSTAASFGSCCSS